MREGGNFVIDGTNQEMTGHSVGTVEQAARHTALCDARRVVQLDLDALLRERAANYSSDVAVVAYRAAQITTLRAVVAKIKALL